MNSVFTFPMNDKDAKDLHTLEIDQNMKDLFALPFEKRHEENVMNIGTQMNEFPEQFGQQVSFYNEFDKTFLKKVKH